jgi:hypothetical protein
MIKNKGHFYKTKNEKECRSQTYLGKNTALKTTHIEQQIWIVFGVDADKAVFPLDGSCGSWKSVLYVPKYSATTKNKYVQRCLKLEVLTAVLMNMQAFWDNYAIPLQTLSRVLFLDCLHPHRGGSTLPQN